MTAERQPLAPALNVELAAALALFLAAGIVPARPASAAEVSTAAISRGEALFTGAAPLSGRLEGHASLLPPAATVCANCHGERGEAEEASSRDAPAAASITAGALVRTASRRNGPPAAYTAEGFCRALRAGIDPVDVRLPSRMPRFDLSDDDCLALWRYLGEPSSAAGATR